MIATGLDITKIQTLLPHCYPFLLVDKVVVYETNISMTAIKNVTYNEPFFQGNFPQKPIMPSVLILEAMAQTSGLLGFLSADGKSNDVVCYLVGIDKARFKRSVIPGDQLIIEARFLKKKKNIWIYKCEAYVDGKLVVSSEIRYATKIESVKIG